MPSADECLNSEHGRLLEVAERVGWGVARPHAASVDIEARFPLEALNALKEAQILSAAVPAEFGGAGLGVVELSKMCSLLAQHCSATAMILAMHHIQVACIADTHRSSPEWTDYLRRVVSEQRLIASVTSEVGPSGDLRQSVAAVETTAGGWRLTKNATTVSYGAHADDLLITVRRSPDANANDQVLVLAVAGQYRLEDVGGWDTMGMRGTCSPSAVVHAEGRAWQVLDAPFGEIASRSMVPFSHCLWGGVWLGIAEEAVRRTRSLVRDKARKSPGKLPTTAQHLSQVVAKLQLMRSEVEHMATRYTRLRSDRDNATLDGVGYAIQLNNLKLTASETVSEIVTDCMRLGGISAYINQGEHSCARLLRDALSAPIMINNYRLRETNATLLMVHKGV
jgi:acyl-CoA dehydrogenase